MASVDEYLPDAVDGWTWAVELITDAARDRRSRLRAVYAATDVGSLVAELHAALAGTVTGCHGARRGPVARRRVRNAGNRLHSW